MLRTYRALVTDNADPEQLGRLMLQIPELIGEEESYPEWVPPRIPTAAGPGAGWFGVPPIGAPVLVEADSAGLLRWSGAEWGALNTPPPLLVGNYGRRQGFTSPEGLHSFALDEDNGLILLVGDPANPDGPAMYLTFDPSADEVKLGTLAGGLVMVNDLQVVIMSPAGHTVLLDDDADAITLAHQAGAELLSLEAGVARLHGTDLQLVGGAATIVGQGGITLTSDTLGVVPTEALLMSVSFLTALAAALPELMAAATAWGIPTTNTATLLSNIATSLGAGAPYLSTVTESA